MFTFVESATYIHICLVLLMMIIMMKLENNNDVDDVMNKGCSFMYKIQFS